VSAGNKRALTNGIGMKPYPLIGRHDDSRETYLATLPPNERNQTENLMFKFKEVNIKANDGITLKAIVYDPAPSSSNGKNPVVVFISSWGVNKWEYVIPGSELAEKGYTVVSYTARGFWGSGGQINLAGPLDMADISTVIDWTLANTHADPDRIGFSGISYGGGMSILGTAFDSRIRTATSMSCWIDMGQSMLGNGETIRKEAVRMLQVLAVLTGEVSDDLSTLFEDYFSNTDLEFMYAMTKNSSAITFLDTINERKPNIFIANAYGDSLFSPNQFPNFYNALKGNKHMEFAPGDHAGPELPGLLGLPDQVWTRAYQWMDYYVKDAHTDTMTSMPSVVLNNLNSDAIESYSSWDQVTNGFANFQLNTKERLSEVSGKELTFGDDEVASITTGDNANINGGLAYITATVRAYIQKPTHFNLDTIHRKYGAVFQTDKLNYSMRLRGNGKLKLNFIPKTSTTGTFIVYLLDVDTWGNDGKLITFSPWTFKNATPGKVNTVEIEITTTSYDMPARNKFAIVIATRDMLYLDQSPEHVDISFTSGSVLSLPLHN
jgi:predicted acyl esterase